jgi:cation:H+ antiporter
VFAGIGGELFVRGIVGLAHWVRVSPGVVAATVAAFATSSPELTVSVTAAIAGAPQIALGDALGSNVVNIALVLGIVSLMSGLRYRRDAIVRDFLAALCVPLLIGVLAFDGLLSRLDGLLLLGAFAAWVAAALFAARRQRGYATPAGGTHRRWPVVLATGGGLVLLLAAGRLIVDGATGIAALFGVDAFVIGATLVAIGTSTPEIATAVIAKLRRHDEVGLGTLLGSNIFNGLFIVAVASVIAPIPVVLRETAAALGFGLVALAAVFPSAKGLIGRERGLLLVGIFAAYLLAMAGQAPAS